MKTLTNGTTKGHIAPKGQEKVIKKESKPLFSNELENALKESVIKEKEYKEGKRKGYYNVKEMIKSLVDN